MHVHTYIITNLLFAIYRKNISKISSLSFARRGKFRQIFSLSVKLARQSRVNTRAQSMGPQK